jgi:hypothetical protein
MDVEGLKNPLYGLPVYTSKWMPDTLIVMGNRFGKTQAMDLAYHPADQTYRFGGEVITRQALETLMADRPYGKLTGSELSRVFAEQLKTGGPIQPKPALQRSVDVARHDWATSSMGQNVETIFRVGADGRPEAVTRLVDAPSKTSVRNGGESELAWLKRRVDEICWRPT